MDSTDKPSHEGSCFCGTVRFVAHGDPLAMGYCHCQSCRAWSASPVNGFTLWKPEAITIKQGAECIGQYNGSPRSHRKWCTRCGGHLMTDHPQWNLVDVFASMLPTLEFRPGVHVNYAESVLRIRDGLPKLRDFPADLGGSDEAVPE